MISVLHKYLPYYDDSVVSNETQLYFRGTFGVSLKKAQAAALPLGENEEFIRAAKAVH